MRDKGAEWIADCRKEKIRGCGSLINIRSREDEERTIADEPRPQTAESHTHHLREPSRRAMRTDRRTRSDEGQMPAGRSAAVSLEVHKRKQLEGARLVRSLVVACGRNYEKITLDELRAGCVVFPANQILRSRE